MITVAVTLLLGVGPAVPAYAAPTSGRTLHPGTPRQAGLLADHVAKLVPAVESGLSPAQPGEKPLYPGAVVLAARRGVVVEHTAVGHALRYGSSQGDELPRDEWIPMRKDTIFDVASISKLFTATVAMQLVEEGKIDLDAPVAHYIPEFAVNGKSKVTVRHVLTHTAGLPAGLNLNPYPTIPERLAAVYGVALQAEPGTSYLYSDLSLIIVGKVAERVTGQPLDDLVRHRISQPLGLRDTMHNPPTSLRHRIAPTEWQEDDRGLVWGEVHDRTSWLLGGTAGHAGVFSTARDLAVFAQTMLNGGRYGDVRILRPASVRQMLTNHNSHLGPGTDRGLGFDLYKHSFMGAMATPSAAGHTGFTGPSLVIDPATDTLLILLNNRVHPHRSWSDTGPARRAVAGHLARAIAVRPAEGRDAWFSGMADDRTVTLTLPVPGADRTRKLKFGYWWDTEPTYDVASLEVSTDDGESWELLPATLRVGEEKLSSDGTVSAYQGRRWYRGSATLSGDVTHVRWRYVTDAHNAGRGVYVDAVTVTANGRVLFDDSRPADRKTFQADGFTRSRD